MYFNSHRLEQDRIVLTEILQQALCLAVMGSGFWIFSQFSQFLWAEVGFQSELEKALLAPIRPWLLTLSLLMYLAYLGLRWGVRRLWEIRLVPPKAVIVGANSVGQHLTHGIGVFPN